jgi:hypothetical protein
VIAGAINAEAAMQPAGQSLIERLLPLTNGKTMADLLNQYGYQFLVDLVGSLDGKQIGAALNTDAGEHFLAEFIAYLDPYTTVNLIKGEADFPNGGLLKQLILRENVYYSLVTNIPILPPLPIGPGPGHTLDAGVYIPPNVPSP